MIANILCGAFFLLWGERRMFNEIKKTPVIGKYFETDYSKKTKKKKNEQTVEKQVETDIE